ncbi:SusD/RagB family nutrient-binding outer membrane lipoprotein, partial [Flavihumibacter sp. CACIAM 22H1]|uniref:SusD/RagB family nutrient-binding outer membrane lipoprotein n=1 Tax=Flavihumibacter sp. CACIAM 22H1 TaxID=1812911 RepID=UPI0025BF1E26
MKLRKYKTQLLVAGMLTLVIGGCTKNFEQINTNPILITKDVIRPSMLFTLVLKNTIFASHNGGTFNEYSNYYANQGSGTIFQARDWGGNFTYAGDLINTAEVIRLTGNDPSLKNQQAVARIWKVWQFHQLTDIFGDLPYSESLLDV